MTWQWEERSRPQCECSGRVRRCSLLRNPPFVVTFAALVPQPRLPFSGRSDAGGNTTSQEARPVRC